MPPKRASSPKRAKSPKRASSPKRAKSPAQQVQGAPPCPADKPYRSVKTGKCYAGATAAGRQAGVCPPKKDRTGKMVEYVAAVVNGQHRCLKAGGATAKSVLGEKGCPAGKVLASVKVKLPGGKMTTGKRCVAPRGDYANKKKCLVGQVLAETTRSGKTPDGKKWEKRVRVCVTRETAMKKGYKVVSEGTVQKPFKMSKKRA